MRDHSQNISNADFGRLCKLIYAESGILISAEKKTMLELRIRRRLHSLDLQSYDEYCDYLFGKGGQQEEEIVHLIDVVTTNKTDFFREPDHFEFLLQKGLGELTSNSQGNRQLLIWSAGCASGEEPYTLAMLLSEYERNHPGFRFSVLATDISTTVLEKAQRGIFESNVVDPVPADLRRRYLMRSRDPKSTLLRIVPELRRAIEFRRLNFMDEDFRLPQKADAIFCRNVIIYFDRKTQEQILQKLTAQLVAGGYIFVGHSESLHDMKIPVTPIAPAIYRKTDAGA